MPHRRCASILRCASLLLALAISACASSSGASSDGGGQTAAPPARGGSNMIIRAELEARPGQNAYEIIQDLHRTWLREDRRGASFGLGGPRYALVVVDGTPRGELDELRQMSANEIEYIRFLSGPDATIKYGTGYPGGAIEVTSRGRR